MTDDAPGELDLLVLGSGVAGLSAAVHAASRTGLRVGVLTKGELDQSATRWAQGGVAAALGGDDSADLHLADTLAAGAGLCDVDAVRVLVDEGPTRVNALIALGAVFDRDHRGELLRAREGGHSMPRVVHAGGAATGAEIERALVAAARDTAACVLEGWFALDLLVEGGRCRGVVALNRSGEVVEVRATHTLLATGGAGQLFWVTTNPTLATGDGLAMALRAGARCADVEFVQFHPTALDHPSMPRPLLSEALRGHGALLRDATGDRFVDELLPRDQVSRAMHERMLAQDVDHLWLDATALERFGDRFPTIAAVLGSVGLDPSTDWLPVAPAAHYTCGGVIVDLDGATTIPGLWAAGEVACSGVHGANRLASNSLLEGMVFAPRIVEAIERGKERAEPTGAMRVVVDESTRQVAPAQTLPSDGGRDARERAEASTVGAMREELQRSMTRYAGVVRSADSLATARECLASLASRAPHAGSSRDAGVHELANLLAVAAAVVAAAEAREESRGCHTRSDFPEPDPRFASRIVL